jgi:hypothetical protein
VGRRKGARQMRTIVELNPYGRHMGIEYSVAVEEEGIVAPMTPENRRREPLEQVLRA